MKSLCIVALLFLLSCTDKFSVENALNISGENRIELETVIHHFSAISKDPQKLQAAEFLIRNMPAHYHMTYNQALYEKMDSLNRSDVNLNELYLKCDSLKQRYPLNPTVKLDINSLKSDFLIRHIDRTVDCWRQSLWYDPARFDDFCEYILPYAAANEPRDFWLDYYREGYRSYLDDYVNETDPDSLSLVRFCDYLNDGLIKNGKMVLNGKLLSNYSPLLVDHIRSGICNDYGARVIFIMRSLGLPVCFDFSPQWSGYATSHTWNVLVGNDNKVYPFMGFDENMSQWKIPPSFHCSKVFRQTYSIQQESLAARYSTMRLPDFLSMPNIKDVTDEYIPVYSVEVDIERQKNADVAYLCVFKNAWSVVHWGEISRGKAVFDKMGAEVLYMPACYTDGQLLQAGHPFYIDSAGNKKEIILDVTRKQKLLLERKYPYSIKTTMFLKRMLKGRFQGSNTPDFRPADDLYTINELPKITPNVVEFSSCKKYRYVRYIGAQMSFTNIAEAEFYSTVGDLPERKMLQGKIIGTDNDHRIDDRGYDLKNVFDGDPLTFFNSTHDMQAWVGLDLGIPQQVGAIRYIPRNDDNNIRVGDTYEVVFWDHDRWKSLGTQVANSEQLIFENCPVNALFLLHNHTRGNEERIFTYEDGKQKFW